MNKPIQENEWREATDDERADFARRYSQPDPRPESDGAVFFCAVVAMIVLLLTFA